MPKFGIIITDDTGNNEEISTSGYALLYLDGNDQIKVKGNIETKALMPIISKLVVEKMMNGKNSTK